MRQFTSEAAKSLITIIGTEYAMAQKRVEQNFIKADQMLGTLLERLNRLSCDNVNLRKFLDNVGHIPIEEDESMSLEWAKDPRPEDEPYDDGKEEPSYGSAGTLGSECDNALTRIQPSKRDF